MDSPHTLWTQSNHTVIVRECQRGTAPGQAGTMPPGPVAPDRPPNLSALVAPGRLGVTRPWLPMSEASTQEDLPRQRHISPAVGCLLSLFIGGAGVACLVLILQLALRGDIVLARGSANETRVWLVREATSEGLGWSTSHAASRDSSGRAVCVETRVRFYFWRADGSARDVTYCDCNLESGERHIDGSCPSVAP
jgi:hypothetical protein